MIDEIKIKFGKYKGSLLKNIPNDYLKWCIENEALKGRAMFYAKQKLNYPKEKYEVTVEDSVNGDGVYIVEAYNTTHAMHVCQRENKIQNTQSFHGTSYSVIKL
jgi:hypothetical protein